MKISSYLKILFLIKIMLILGNKINYNNLNISNNKAKMMNES